MFLITKLRLHFCSRNINVASLVLPTIAKRYSYTKIAKWRDIQNFEKEGIVGKFCNEKRKLTKLTCL